MKKNRSYKFFIKLLLGLAFLAALLIYREEIIRDILKDPNWIKDILLN